MMFCRFLLSLVYCIIFFLQTLSAKFNYFWRDVLIMLQFQIYLPKLQVSPPEPLINLSIILRQILYHSINKIL